MRMQQNKRLNRLNVKRHEQVLLKIKGRDGASLEKPFPWPFWQFQEVQNRNKPNEHVRIRTGREVLEKLIWKNQTVLAWRCSAKGAGSCPAAGTHLGWTDPDVWQPWTESQHPRFEGLKFWTPAGPVLSYHTGDKASRLLNEPGCLDRAFCREGAAPALPNPALWHLTSKPNSGRKEPNPHAAIWKLVCFGKWTFSDEKQTNKKGPINFQPKF